MDDKHDRSAHDAPDPEDQPLPGSVGDNGEEQPGGAGGAEHQRKPDSDDGDDDDRGGSSGGESSEGSQSTGDPHSAG